MVEFALILPLFLILLMGMLEFGIVFDHRNAMSYAVREGARVGASLGNGGSQASAWIGDPRRGAARAHRPDPRREHNLN